MRLSKGIGYMLLASFLFTTMNVFVKAVGHIPPIEIILFRSVISLIISVSLLRSQRVSVWGNNKKYLIGRGLSGAVALLTFFTLIQQIPLATASSLARLAPIFTTILGIFLLKEKVLPLQWVFFIISFAGVLMIQGFDPRIAPVHVLMGIGASFFMGLAYNFIRMLKTTEHPLVIIFYFPLIMLPFSGIWSAFVWVQPQGIDWLYLLMTGILTQFAQFFMTKAYQSSELNQVSIIGYTGILFAFSYGYWFFGETFEMVTIIGMMLIIGGVIANVLVKWK